RTALRSFRISLRYVRAGRQRQGRDPRRWQPVRGSALPTLPDTAAGTALRRHAVCQSRSRSRLQAVSAALRQPVPRLPKSGPPADWSMPLLGVLGMVWVRQLLQGIAADDDSAGAAAKVEFFGS